MTSVPNGKMNETATPISQVERVLSHHGPNASEGCRAMLISAAIPTTYEAIAKTQIAAKMAKKPANGSIKNPESCASFTDRA